MTSASLTASGLERAMTQPRPFEHSGAVPAPIMPTDDDAPSSLIGALATRLTEWRRRAKQARAFRGFDRHQLRDLGINHFDQW
jgi:uncharacterized protein YjiS (DUF1127 family)